jgi:hypothetical protein
MPVMKVRLSLSSAKSAFLTTRKYLACGHGIEKREVDSFVHVVETLSLVS